MNWRHQAGDIERGLANKLAGIDPCCFNSFHKPNITLTQLGELQIDSLADGYTDPSEEVVALGPDDFQRIGIRPKETRLDVIRRAASRAARSLARRQLRSPNPLTEQQLSRIAVSTYRLLDPRQREDRYSRAHVGRIRPGVLYQAGRTSFADGRNLIHTKGTLESADAAATHHTSKFCNASDGGGLSVQPLIDGKAELDAIFPLFHQRPSFLARIRRQSQRPGTILAIMIALLLSAAALWMWGQNLRSSHHRLAPVSAETQPRV